MDETAPQKTLVNILGRAIPCIFGLIGLTVCIFLWAAPFGEWNSPPLFFRVFGTFIGAIFMLFGFGTAIAGPSLLAGVKSLATHHRSRARRSIRTNSQDSYDCPNCGSGLQSDADVSPRGDVKCAFCDRWFNIHQPGA